MMITLCKVHKYNPLIHKEHLITLFKSRAVSPSMEIPENGFIAYNLLEEEFVEHPIAAGFLRRMEGPYGLVDSFISNPSFDLEFRNEALVNIMDKIIQLSKEYQLSHLFAFSSHQGIISRAMDKGFKQDESMKLLLFNLKGSDHHLWHS